jgi:hypothetical protein
VGALRNLNAKLGCIGHAPDYSHIDTAMLSDMSCVVMTQRCACREIHG